MCGIAGYWDFRAGTQREELAAVASAMIHTLVHRGPDDGAVWTDAAAGIALGHRRLSILDLSARGSQPMHSACGRYAITFNGEIYNFAELRERLEIAGCRFRGSSDTEVMLAACAAWGLETALREFNGMFAFALWDRAAECLYLARDRAGEKPLYFGGFGHEFLFASELKAFRAAPRPPGEIDPGAVALFARHGYVPAPYTVYRGVKKLLPGHWMKVTRSGAQPPVSYWSARDTAEVGLARPFEGSADEAIARLESLLRDAVLIRMAADVPLGAFLSGGVDSSTVVSLMQSQTHKPVLHLHHRLPRERLQRSREGAGAVARAPGN